MQGTIPEFGYNSPKSRFRFCSRLELSTPINPLGPRLFTSRVCPVTWHARTEDRLGYSSTRYSTSALDAPRHGRFTPVKKTRYPLYTRLGGPWGRYGWVRKISPPAEFKVRTVQPAASSYSSRPKLFTYEKIIVFVLRTPLPREGVGNPYAAKTSRRIISVSKKLKAHVLFSNSVICNAYPF